ncbi:MAG: Rrf2 family transcriptional regulator [Fusobacteriaceae bacterium]|jgi:Rrf2 family protein|nr:Rrf2 family transcriptional regulator [Fusobacteriaceae bacterium]
MRLTNEVEYGFRTIHYLTNVPKGKIISSVEISNNEKIPHLFGLRILKKLADYGLVEVFKGSRGGYRLKKDPKRISLKDVIEAIEDKINISSGIAKRGSCSDRYEKSGIAKAILLIEKEFVKGLGSVNFAEFIKKK